MTRAPVVFEIQVADVVERFLRRQVGRVSDGAAERFERFVALARLRVDHAHVVVDIGQIRIERERFVEGLQRSCEITHRGECEPHSVVNERTTGIEFDRILVDAPCSGTGTIRKSFKTLRIWNPNMVKRLSITQKQLLETAFNILKDNGTLIYSTCSLEPEENESVVDFLLEKYDNAIIEDIKINNLKRSHAVLEFEKNNYNKNIKKCLRIWPQDNDTEGFFVAKITKS